VSNRQQETTTTTKTSNKPAAAEEENKGCQQLNKAGGRKHLVIRLGIKGAGWVYAMGMFTSFAIIIALPLVGLSSYWIYLALFPLPLAIKASIGAIKDGDNIAKLIPAMGANVITVLATDLLIAVAIFIEVM